ARRTGLSRTARGNGGPESEKAGLPWGNPAFSSVPEPGTTAAAMGGPGCRARLGFARRLADQRPERVEDAAEGRQVLPPIVQPAVAAGAVLLAVLELDRGLHDTSPYRIRGSPAPAVPYRPCPDRGKVSLRAVLHKRHLVTPHMRNIYSS